VGKIVEGGLSPFEWISLLFLGAGIINMFYASNSDYVPQETNSVEVVSERKIPYENKYGQSLTMTIKGVDLNSLDGQLSVDEIWVSEGGCTNRFSMPRTKVYTKEDDKFQGYLDQLDWKGIEK
jgi:hypothetical protein